MFGKAKPPTPPGLSDRVRQLRERDPPIAPKPQARQRPPRERVFKDATLQLRDGTRFRVSIKDLSETGARIEFHANIDLPARVILSAPGLRLRRFARVVWREAMAAGLQFIDG